MAERKSKRAPEDDWRSWQAEDAPDPPLLTRTEVLALVERWKIQPSVDERTLRYWEKQGLVPHPVRSYHAGAVRSRYPSWVADLIAFIRQEQKRGRSLAELGPVMREQARRLSAQQWDHPFPAKPTLLQRLGLTVDGPRLDPSLPGVPPPLPLDTEAAVIDALMPALGLNNINGFRATQIIVRLTDADGKRIDYRLPVPDRLPGDPRPSAWPPGTSLTELHEISDEPPTNTEGGVTDTRC